MNRNVRIVMLMTLNYLENTWNVCPIIRTIQPQRVQTDLTDGFDIYLQCCRVYR